MGYMVIASRFSGSGTKEDPFTPVAAVFGHDWSLLDLREDETKPDGWCLVAVDVSAGVTVSHPHVVPLGENPSGEIEEGARKALSLALKRNLVSVTLGDLVLEALIHFRSLRPKLDGRYELHLAPFHWEYTSQELRTFLAEHATHVESRPGTAINSSTDVLHALAVIESLAELGAPRWVHRTLTPPVTEQGNPLLFHLREARRVVSEDFASASVDRSTLWLVHLAHLVEVTREVFDDRELARRLRQPNDCESVRYEMYVASRYLRAGATVRRTDRDRAGEFIATSGAYELYVECKKKSQLTLRDRDRTHLLDGLIVTADEEMQSTATLGRFVDITCRTDPAVSELSAVRRLVRNHLASGYQDLRSGKFRIRSWKLDPTELTLPAGLDLGFVEAQIAEAGLTQGRGVGVRVLIPPDWLKSALDSFRNATKQLPGDAAGVVYLDVPTEREPIVAGWVEQLANALSAELVKHGRVSAAVVTGSSYPEVDGKLILRTVVRSVMNPSARRRIPEWFAVAET